MIDSTLEIGFKEYLAFENQEHIAQSKLNSILQNRTDVTKEIRRLVPHITIEQWGKINYYYKMRCNLIHQLANSNVKDEDVLDYKEVVKSILVRLFSIKF